MSTLPCDASDESSAANGDKDGIEARASRQLVDTLVADRPLPSDYLPIVVWRNVYLQIAVRPIRNGMMWAAEAGSH